MKLNIRGQEEKKNENIGKRRKRKMALRILWKDIWEELKRGNK